MGSSNLCASTDAVLVNFSPPHPYLRWFVFSQSFIIIVVHNWTEIYTRMVIRNDKVKNSGHLILRDHEQEFSRLLGGAIKYDTDE